jgi:hypothetical protein
METPWQFQTTVEKLIVEIAVGPDVLLILDKRSW